MEVGYSSEVSEDLEDGFQVFVITAEGSAPGLLRKDDSIIQFRRPSEVDDMMRHGSSFDGMLFRLMQKADNNNLVILGKAFPKQYAEWSNWFRQDLT